MIFHNQGYDESVFSDFYVDKDSTRGPGWFIHGRNIDKYGLLADGPNAGKGRYVMNCGQRTAPKWHCRYNGRVSHGWRTKRDAQAALAMLLSRWPQLKEGKVAHITLAEESYAATLRYAAGEI